MAYVWHVCTHPNLHIFFLGGTAPHWERLALHSPLSPAEMESYRITDVVIGTPIPQGRIIAFTRTSSTQW